MRLKRRIFYVLSEVKNGFFLILIHIETMRFLKTRLKPCYDWLKASFLGWTEKSLRDKVKLSRQNQITEGFLCLLGRRFY